MPVATLTTIMTTKKYLQTLPNVPRERYWGKITQIETQLQTNNTLKWENLASFSHSQHTVKHTIMEKKACFFLPGRTNSNVTLDRKEIIKKNEKENKTHLQAHYLHHHFESFSECRYSLGWEKEGIWVSNWKKIHFFRNYMIHWHWWEADSVLYSSFNSEWVHPKGTYCHI